MDDSPFEGLRREMERIHAQFRDVLRVPDALQEAMRYATTLAGLSADQMRAITNPIPRDVLHAAITPIMADTLDHARRLSELIPSDISERLGLREWSTLVRDPRLDWVTSEIRDALPHSAVAAALQDVHRLQDLQAVWVASLPAASILFRDLASAGSFPGSGSFGGEVRRHLAEIDASDADDESAIVALRAIVDIVIGRCAALLPGVISYEGMINILLTLCLFWLAHNDGASMEARLNTRIQESERRQTEAFTEAARRMTEAIERLRPPAPAEAMARRRVVVRETRLRGKPDSRSRPIRVMYPNEVLEELSVKGSWIEVRAFDYAKGDATTGWILARFTKVLEK